MVEIIEYNEKVRLNYLLNDYYVNIAGVITDGDGVEISLSDFNHRTSLGVKDVFVLVKLAFGSCKIAPVYWKNLVALKSFDERSTPETLVLGFDSPVNSLEYPGYYLIPNFTNYVISECGRVIKKSNGSEIKASVNPLGYYTYRLTDDEGQTQNQLRHRILGYAFLEYPYNVDELDINHKNGIPGDDRLINLEWCTRSENIDHAFDHGLRTDNKPVEVRDTNTGRVLYFRSCSIAGKYFGVTGTTVSSRAKSNGYKSFDGFQYRFLQENQQWPLIDNFDGRYQVVFPDGSSKKCSCLEAASLAGLTRTSLLRALREGRNKGTNDNIVYRV